VQRHERGRGGRQIRLERRGRCELVVGATTDAAAGGGVRYSGAEQALQAVCGHPQEMGAVGSTDTTVTNALVREHRPADPRLRQRGAVDVPISQQAGTTRDAYNRCLTNQ
jgi:hypothetical protein